MENRNLNDLRVVDLKKELDIRGLSKQGTKKELIDRLKAQREIEELRVSAGEHGEDDVPSLKVDGEEENEFVKNYLQQRQKLLSQQLEQRKKFEESQSECETDEVGTTETTEGGTTTNIQQQQQESDNDDTDVESNDADTSLPLDTNESEAVISEQCNIDEHPDTEGDGSRFNMCPSHDDRQVRTSSSPVEETPHSQSRSRSNSPVEERGRSRSRSSSESVPHKSIKSARSKSRSNSSSQSNDRSRSVSAERSRSPAQERGVKLNEEMECEINELTSLETPLESCDYTETAMHDDNVVVQPVLLTSKEYCSNDNADTAGAGEGDVIQKSNMTEVPTNGKPDTTDNSNSVISSQLEAVKPVRKRRWGSTAVRPSINISTDSLKGLIPDIDAAALAAEPTMEIDETGDNEAASHTMNIKNIESVEQTDTRSSKVRRTVYKAQESPEEGEIEDKEVVVKMDEQIEPVRIVKPPAVETRQNQTAAGSIARTSELRQSNVRRTVSLTVEDPVDVGRKSPSPSRHPVSTVIHVTGLVRPFTLGQLKELLSRTGNLVPDGFWIDNIKSHCYVVYEAEDQATATRKALHGKRWPASNPKLLGVDFRTLDEFEKRKNNVMIHTAVTPVVPEVKPSVQPTPPTEAKKEHEKSRGGRETKDKSVREWDRHKLRQSRSASRDQRKKDDKSGRNESSRDKRNQVQSSQRSRGRARVDKSGGGAKVDEEPPAKLLDDLFRKTVAMPCIYWLPLTDEQAAEKIAQEKKDKLVREQRRAEREQQLEVERQQRLKEQPRSGRYDQRQAPAQRRQFAESDEPVRRRGRSRSAGRVARR